MNKSQKAHAKTIGATAISGLFLLCLNSGASAQILRAADLFSMRGRSAVTNTGGTTPFGNPGVWPGTAITGVPKGVVSNDAKESRDAIAERAQVDLTVPYNVVLGNQFDPDLSGQDLGGLRLIPGVYQLGATAPRNGMLTLDALGDANARFDFMIRGSFLLHSSGAVVMPKTADAYNNYSQIRGSHSIVTQLAVLAGTEKVGDNGLFQTSTDRDVHGMTRSANLIVDLYGKRGSSFTESAHVEAVAGGPGILSVSMDDLDPDIAAYQFNFEAFAGENGTMDGYGQGALIYRETSSVDKGVPNTLRGHGTEQEVMSIMSMVSGRANGGATKNGGLDTTTTGGFPEPAAFVALGIGLVGLLVRKRFM